MNWYKGNIAQAVAESKVKNAIFVVFVEGKDETTQKLNKFIDDEKVRSKLESDNFVAIKIESESEAYMQFATIYQVVPVPSIFFIGKSGTPLEIATGVIASVDELEQKIEKVLATTKSGSASASSTTSFIAAEQASTTAEKTTASTSAPKQSLASAAQEADDEIVCDGDVCYKKPKAAATKIESAKAEANKAQQETAEVSAVAATAANTTNVDARLEETRKMLEQKRRERIAMEQKTEKELELERRKSGRDTQNQQQYQKEQVLKELKENLRRERLEEQAVRDRIRAQIAGDRAERAHKFSTEETGGAAAPAASSAPKPVPQASDVARLQFRLSNGDTKVHSFNCQETLSTVRSYVKTEILPGTGIKGDFILATTYPKREFAAEHETKTVAELELFPSAVILVIGKESKLSPNAIISRSGGLVNMFTTLFWALLSPVFAVFGYMKSFAAGGGGKNGDDNTGAQKRANEEQGAQQDAAKRRNLDRFLSNNEASTSKEATAAAATTTADAAAGGGGGESKPYRRYGSSNVHRLTDNRKDSDDENATWNGNSTQQQ